LSRPLPSMDISTRNLQAGQSQRCINVKAARPVAITPELALLLSHAGHGYTADGDTTHPADGGEGPARSPDCESGTELSRASE
jgi:hypothetical protein